MWYKIIEEGVSPEEEGFYEYKLNSFGNVEAPRITIKYEGKLVSTGYVFDKNDKTEGIEFLLGTLINGWKIAFLPKTITDSGKVLNITDLTGLSGLTELGLQKGSKIRLVIPSPYAYQDKSQPSVPANSPLDFTIEVLKVEAPTSTQ
jgi:FKBP-type peptidyl-prolyl cis-trans isomerase FkpA